MEEEKEEEEPAVLKTPREHRWQGKNESVQHQVQTPTVWDASWPIDNKMALKMSAPQRTLTEAEHVQWRQFSPLPAHCQRMALRQFNLLAYLLNVVNPSPSLAFLQSISQGEVSFLLPAEKEKKMLYPNDPTLLWNKVENSRKTWDKDIMNENGTGRDRFGAMLSKTIGTIWNKGFVCLLVVVFCIFSFDPLLKLPTSRWASTLALLGGEF